MPNIATNFELVKKTRNNNSLLLQSLGTVSIDSLKIRVPTRYINNFNISRLRETIITLDFNGEVIKERANYHLKSEGFMIGLRAANCGKSKNEEELVLMLSSKALGGERYFEGITNENISIAYHKINSTLSENGIGSLPYRAFMSGYVTDMDIKSDYLDSKGLNLSRVGNHIIDTNSPKRTISQFSVKGRASYKTGLQLGVRKSGTQGNPFYKFYNKGLEIHQSISEANDSFFNSIPSVANDSEIRNVWRAEVTMKNSAMLKANNLPNRLGLLLDMKEEQLRNVLESNFMKWVKKEIKPIEKREIRVGFKVEELVLINCIENDLITYESYLNLMNIGGTPQRTIERKKRRFMELYDIAKVKTSKPQNMPQNSSQTDSNNLGNSSSDLGSFCGGILYCANS